MVDLPHARRSPRVRPDLPVLPMDALANARLGADAASTATLPGGDSGLHDGEVRLLSRTPRGPIASDLAISVILPLSDRLPVSVDREEKCDFRLLFNDVMVGEGEPPLDVDSSAAGDRTLVVRRHGSRRAAARLL